MQRYLCIYLSISFLSLSYFYSIFLIKLSDLSTHVVCLNPFRVFFIYHMYFESLPKSFSFVSHSCENYCLPSHIPSTPNPFLLPPQPAEIKDKGERSTCLVQLCHPFSPLTLFSPHLLPLPPQPTPFPFSVTLLRNKGERPLLVHRLCLLCNPF